MLARAGQGRAGDEQLRRIPDHDRVVAPRNTRGTLPRDRTQGERHDRHLLQTLRRKAPDLHLGQQRVSQRFNILDRAAAARSVDQAH